MSSILCRCSPLCKSMASALDCKACGEKSIKSRLGQTTISKAMDSQPSLPWPEATRISYAQAIPMQLGRLFWWRGCSHFYAKQEPCNGCCQCKSQSAMFKPVRAAYPRFKKEMCICSLEEEDDVMDAVLLHCLDHVAAGAQAIKKHNEALKADPSSDVPRDQGFARPKASFSLCYLHLCTFQEQKTAACCGSWSSCQSLHNVVPQEFPHHSSLNMQPLSA